MDTEGTRIEEGRGKGEERSFKPFRLTFASLRLCVRLFFLEILEKNCY